MTNCRGKDVNSKARPPSKPRPTIHCGWLIFLLVLFAVIMYLRPNYIGFTGHGEGNTRSNRGKQNLHNIQLALERYSMDHGSYPLDFTTLAHEGYLPVLPDNPYSQTANAERSMLPLAPDDPPSAGDFVYARRFDASGARVIGYTLCLYGRKGELTHKHPGIPAGVDASRLIILLDSGADRRAAADP